MSSPKRAAKIVAKAIVAKNAARSAAKVRPAVTPVPLKRSEAAADGASADAKKLAATLHRGIAGGSRNARRAEASRTPRAAPCRVYTARLEAGEQFMPIPRNSI